MAGSAADYVTIIAGFLSIVASFLNFPIFTVIVVLLFVLSACTSVYIITRLLLVVNKSHGNLIYRLKHIYMTAINTHKQEDFNCTQLMQKYDSDFYTILGELCKLIKIITKKR